MEEKLNRGLMGRKGRKRPPADITSIPSREMLHGIAPDEELLSILDKIPGGIILTDSKGCIRQLNRDAKSLLGDHLKTGDGLHNIGFQRADGVTPYPGHELPLKFALLGESRQAEMMLRRENEAHGIWVSMSAEPIKRTDGTLEGAIVFIQDITHYKRVEVSREKHIRQTESFYKLSHSISEAGNNLKQLSNAIAKFTAEVIGDLSMVVLRDSGDARMEITSFFDRDPAGHALMKQMLAHGNHFN